MEIKQHMPEWKWVKEDIKEEIKVFLELNKNKNITQQNLWDNLKEALRGKSIVLSAYIKKSESHNIGTQASGKARTNGLQT